MTESAEDIKIGALTVKCLGELIDDPAFYKVCGKIITVFPVGYTIVRMGPAKDSSSAEVPYTATITRKEGESVPSFTVTPSDDAEQAVTSHSATVSWQTIIQARKEGKSVSVSGFSKFGINDDRIIDLLRKLPNGPEIFEKAESIIKQKSQKTTAPAPKPMGPIVCKDCGLTTPFCAASGKPHAFISDPCPLCGLVTEFCANTGQRHVRAAPVQETKKRPRAATKAKEENTDGTKKQCTEQIASSETNGDLVASAGEMPKTGAKSAKKPRGKKGDNLQQTTLPEMKVLGAKSSTDTLLKKLNLPVPLRNPINKIDVAKAKATLIPHIENSDTYKSLTSKKSKSLFSSFMFQYSSERTRVDFWKKFEEAKKVDKSEASVGGNSGGIKEEAIPSADEEKSMNIVPSPMKDGPSVPKTPARSTARKSASTSAKKSVKKTPSVRNKSSSVAN